ncbi:MAG: ribosome silencing factor [Nitrospirae bacterium]|nr:ribosome silencing factor [Nitrospirota bacterium]
MENVAVRLERNTSLKDAPDVETTVNLKVITNLLSNKKGRDIIILELFRLTSFTDYFIICTGENAMHLNAMAEDVELNLRDSGKRPISVNGQGFGQWILMDYNDIIVHIFDEATRKRYNLEALWLDANRIELI